MSNEPCYLGIIMPAYNETDRILPTLKRLQEYYSSQDYSWQVTVVDDGSLDETAKVTLEFAVQNPNFRLLSYQPNCGKGFAVRKGMLETSAELLLFCDADLATPQEETEKLLSAIKKGADVAIGSRPLRESYLKIRQPWYREMLGRAFNHAVQLLAIKGIQDTQCGFKMFTHSAAKEIFSRCQVNRYAFDIEALLVAHDLGLTIDEVPISWAHQEGSKVSIIRDGTKMLFDLFKLRLATKRNRLEIKSLTDTNV